MTNSLIFYKKETSFTNLLNFPFQTAYEAGHSEAVMKLVEKYDYEVNFLMPSSGLSLFLVRNVTIF